MSETQLWYIKKNGRVTGPFAAGLISRHILLGRIHPDDYLSRDKTTWQKASSVPEVRPDVIKHRNDPNYKERLRAARRWADERGEVREKGTDGQEHVFVPRKKYTRLSIKTLGFVGITVIILLIGGLVYMSFLLTPEYNVAIDCDAPPVKERIFDGCKLNNVGFADLDLSGISIKNSALIGSRFNNSIMRSSSLDYSNMAGTDLSGTDLTGASLKGTNLSGAILNKTNFTNADLSYADLTGAKSAGLILTNTLLNKTIWFDGKICAKESVGRCRVTTERR